MKIEMKWCPIQSRYIQAPDGKIIWHSALCTRNCTAFVEEISQNEEGRNVYEQRCLMMPGRV